MEILRLERSVRTHLERACTSACMEGNRSDGMGLGSLDPRFSFSRANRLFRRIKVFSPPCILPTLLSSLFVDDAHQRPRGLPVLHRNTHAHTKSTSSILTLYYVYIDIGVVRIAMRF